MAQLWHTRRDANDLLRAHLNGAAAPPGYPGLFTSWAACIPTVGLPPDVAYSSCMGRFDLPESIARLQFLFNAPRFDPPTTVPSPPIPKQTSDYSPASVHDILTPEALRDIYHWFSRELDDYLSYAQDQPRRRCLNKALVIDQGGFLPLARGVIWDLTAVPPRPMQRHLPARPRLNAEAILAAAGTGYPDQELLHAIQHGVRMPTDFQPLVVLNSGLLSLADGLEQLAAHISRI
jgi:hypothetical protein